MENKLINRELFSVERNNEHNIIFKLTEKGKYERGIPLKEDYIFPTVIEGKCFLIEKKAFSDRFIFIMGVNSMEDTPDEETVGELNLNNKSTKRHIEKMIILYIYDTEKNVLFDDDMIYVFEGEDYDMIPSFDSKEVIIRYSHVVVVLKYDGFSWKEKVDHFIREDEWNWGRSMAAFGNDRYAEIENEEKELLIKFFKFGKDETPGNTSKFLLKYKKTISIPKDVEIILGKKFILTLKNIRHGLKDTSIGNLLKNRELILMRYDVKASYKGEYFVTDLTSPNTKGVDKKFRRNLYVISREMMKKYQNRLDNYIYLSRDGFFFLICGKKESVYVKDIFVIDIMSGDLSYFGNENCDDFEVYGGNNPCIYMEKFITGDEGINPSRVKSLDIENKEKYISMMLEGIKEKDIF